MIFRTGLLNMIKSVRKYPKLYLIGQKDKVIGDGIVFTKDIEVGKDRIVLTWEVFDPNKSGGRYYIRLETPGGLWHFIHLGSTMVYAKYLHACEIKGLQPCSDEEFKKRVAFARRTVRGKVLVVK